MLRSTAIALLAIQCPVEIETPATPPVALLGQSNALGRSQGPLPVDVGPGTLIINGVESATFEARVGIEPILTNDAGYNVLKRAVGGTSIEEWLAPNGLLDQAFDDAAINGVTPMATVWIQGERNARLGTTDYGVKILDLAERVEAEWGPQVWTIPLLSHLPEADFPGMMQINSDYYVLEDNGFDVEYIDTWDIEKNSDNVHYSRNGYNDLGERVVGVLP